MPSDVSASRTSSSLNGLKMAIIIFIRLSSNRRNTRPKIFNGKNARGMPTRFLLCFNGLASGLLKQGQNQQASFGGGRVAYKKCHTRLWVVHILHNRHSGCADVADG